MAKPSLVKKAQKAAKNAKKACPDSSDSVKDLCAEMLYLWGQIQRMTEP